MPNRYPLVVASGVVQELADGDNLDLTGNNIVGLSSISGGVVVTGIATFSQQVGVTSTLVVAAPGSATTTGVFHGRVGINTGNPASSLSVSRRLGITTAGAISSDSLITVACETLKDNAGLTTARVPGTGVPVSHFILNAFESIATSAGIETSNAQQASLNHTMSRSFVRPSIATSIFSSTNYGQMIIVAGIGTIGTHPNHPSFTDVLLTGYSSSTSVTVIGKNEGGGATPSGRIYTIASGISPNGTQDPSGGTLRVSIGATGSASGYNVMCYAITAAVQSAITGRDFS